MRQTVEEAAKKYSSQWAWNSQPDMWQSEKDFKAGAEWQAKQFPWISVEDAIPNKQAKGMCQVKYVDGSIDEMAMREVNKWIYPYIKTGYVTHWKPIPSFDEILEANKDVLERIKEKGD
jgi:hypothetical protein|nr:MAG TPA: Protein of unknown function (DUF551) [Caudoviricetes sp.]